MSTAISAGFAPICTGKKSAFGTFSVAGGAQYLAEPPVSYPKSCRPPQTPGVLPESASARPAEVTVLGRWKVHGSMAFTLLAETVIHCHKALRSFGYVRYGSC